MNAVQTAQLCLLVSTLRPQQRMEAATDDHPGTAAVWFGVLQDVSYKDAIEAVRRLAKREAFIDTGDIVEEVKLIRAARFDALPEARRPAPNIDPEDQAAYRRELAAIRRAIADGLMTPENAADYTRSGITLSGAAPMLAIAAAAEPLRSGEIDLVEVFAKVPKPITEKRQQAQDDEARRRAHHDLDAWEKRRHARLTAKRRRQRS